MPLQNPHSSEDRPKNHHLLYQNLQSLFLTLVPVCKLVVDKRPKGSEGGQVLMILKDFSFEQLVDHLGQV